jgi:hypothetical protein
MAGVPMELGIPKPERGFEIGAEKFCIMGGTP